MSALNSAARFAVEISDVKKSFGKFQALDGVSFNVEQGEFFALLGPNGAGKTTLISALAGLSKPDSGSLKVMGYDVRTQYKQARQALGIVPQEIVFDPFFSVREILRIQSGYFGIRNNDAWIYELLEKLSLTDKADKNMRALSGGMKRRVLVAQALVHKPPVIVLDEPTAGVDVELRQTLWAFVRQLNQQGHTILLTTHYLEEAQQLCSRLCMMKQGKVVALDTTANLLAGFSERVLRVAVQNQTTLPPVLAQKLMKSDSAWHYFSISAYQEVEDILALLRTHNIAIEKLEVTEPELEDVFLKIMKKHES